MQLKRIFVSLLVAMMILSMAVIAASAADTASTTFDVAVEVKDSTADADGNVLVNPGDTLEINVVIKNNPGAAFAQISFVYDATELTPVDADENGKADVTQGDTYNFTNIKNNVVDGKNVLTVISENAGSDIQKTGSAFTIKFVVAEDADAAELGYYAVAMKKSFSTVATNYSNIVI